MRFHFSTPSLFQSIFLQFRAFRDPFLQPDWPHALYATEALFSRVLRVVGAFHAQERL